MFFEIHGLKDINGEKQNIQILVEASNPGDIRDFFMSKNIIVLSIKEYSESLSEFGKISWTFIEKEHQFTFIIDEKTIEDACYLLIYLWFNIRTISSSKETINKEEMKKIINNIQKQIEDEKKEQEEKEITEKEESKKIYDDRRLQKLQNVVDGIFSYIKTLIPKVQNYVDSEMITKLKKEEENLRKLRMWRNASTIKEALTTILPILENIKNSYILVKKKDWIKIFEESVVTDIDVIDEYNKLKKSRLIKNLHIKQSKEDQFYIFFDKIGLFVRFLKKDLLVKFKKIRLWLPKTFDAVEFVLAVITVEFGLFIRANNLMFFTEKQDHIFMFMVHFGVLGFGVWLLKKFLKANTGRVIVLTVIAMIWYFLIMKILSLFFAL